MKNFLRIIAHIKPYWFDSVLNIIFNLISTVFSLFSLTMIAPFLDLLFLKSDAQYQERLLAGKPELGYSVKSLIDSFYYYFTEIITNPDKGKLYALSFMCIIVVVLFFIKNLFRYLATFFISSVRNGVIKDLRNEIFSKSMVLPLAYYSEERKGDLMSRMTTDLQEIEWAIMSSFEAVVKEPITIALFLITLFALNPMLTLIVLVLMPISGLLIGKLGKSLKRTSSKGKEKLGDLMSIIEESLGGLRIIKGFGAEEKVNSNFESVNTRYTTLMNRMFRKNYLSSPVSETLGTIVLVVVMYLGGKMVLSQNENFSAGEFITFIAIFSQLIPPVKSFTTAFYKIQRGMASADRVYEILDEDLRITEIENPKKLESFTSNVLFDNISFSYGDESSERVLKNIQVNIEKGKTVALVGQSGSGKSTLVDMLPRFYDPIEGNVFIDDINLREISLGSLRSKLGIVSQESILFNDSIANNIAFGVNTASKEQIEQAAKVANAHDFILKAENGYDTVIGDRGVKLSGGQKQRLSIARAILVNPPILILDEATSALDTESERLVQDALNNLMKNRTSLIIAHRLSTIQNADEILVMSEGEIVERGTHNELLSKNGAYKKLYDLQSFN
ncbi:MAG: ATP-binding cassette domain-containing protein [Bacteroidia bacterium]|nr:ATP-binding cassette domain-containing protein [Bacteroidia bacterium]NNC85605.1 ATP-binding cassette domain-containing protein [Bacteroidia bacterium]NNM15128.1 ATP-binding cassette domain-containing protein [Bacteroidia bacterium]